MNLTNIDIPKDVSNLLQMRKNVCLPINFNKKLAIYEHIKDLESNINIRDTIYLNLLRNLIIQFF